jgi:hypothetical protein
MFKFEKCLNLKNVQSWKTFKLQTVQSWKNVQKSEEKIKTENCSRKWKTKITQNRKNKKKAARIIVLKNENRKLGQAHGTKRAGGDY